MNVQAIIVSDLKKKLAKAESEVTRIRSVLELYGYGGGVSSAPVSAPKRTRRKRRSQAQIDAIKKAQDARATKFAARKAQDEQTQAASGQSQAVRESKPRLPQGSRDVPRGASLAEAAS